MANWLNDPAVKALMPHLELLQEALGVAEIEQKPAARKPFRARRQASRDLSARRHPRRRLPRSIKPAA